MRIAVLQGHSENNVLTGFSEKLNLAFLELGCCSVMYDLRSEIKENARHIVRGSYDLVVSFNAMLSEFPVGQAAEAKSLAKAVGRSFLAWFVDDTLYHANRILALPNEGQILTPSRGHELFVRKLGNLSSVQQLLAGTTIREFDPYIPFEDREFDILIAGSWMGNPEPFWEQIKDPNLASLFRDLANSLETTAIPNVFERVLRELGNVGIEEVNLNELYPHFIGLHLFIRKWNRLRTVKKVAEQDNLKIAVIGKGWDASLLKYANVIHFDSVSHGDIKRLYRKSRFVICPNTENGACERVFDALEVGAIPIAEKCSSLGDIPALGDFIIFHDPHSNTDSKYLLDQVNNWHDYNLIARCAQEHVRKHETWLNRAQKLLTIATHETI